MQKQTDIYKLIQLKKKYNGSLNKSLNMYISIGTQCTTSTLFDRLCVKKESLPFDWMFSTPQFVYTILKLLLIEQLDIDNIIDNEFLVCDNRAKHSNIQEHYITDSNGTSLINSKYNVCFPHDVVSDRDKYIRRMQRLKQIILDKDNFLYFVYISSPNKNNYMIDHIKPIQDLYEYILMINNILKDIRNNYKIIIFDTNRPSDIIPPSDNFIYYDIKEKDNWKELLPELINKCNNLIS